MELAGEVVIGMPPQRVWEAINDPEILRVCIPGCEEVRQVSPTETHTRVLMKMGPVRARFVGKILMRDVRPGEGCVLDFEGSGGAAGFARGSSTVSLTGEPGGTRLRYSATASIGGKLGQIGGRMIDASAKQMADQFFNALQATLDAPAPPSAGDGAAGGADLTAATGAGVGMAASDRNAGTPMHALAGTASGHSMPAAAVISPRPPAAVPGSAGTANSGAGLAGESVRILWFVLGMASTGFGVWLAGLLAH